MPVTTGGRSWSAPESVSSSSITPPSTERISRSKPNLSATSLASVGSSRSFTIRMTPSSMRPLISSPDFFRIFSANSATVTDSGTRIVSRLTSAGGAGGATTAATAAGLTETTSGAAVAAGAAGTTGSRGSTRRGSRGGGTGRGGAWLIRGGAKGPDGGRGLRPLERPEGNDPRLWPPHRRRRRRWSRRRRRGRCDRRRRRDHGLGHRRKHGLGCEHHRRLRLDHGLRDRLEGLGRLDDVG